MEKDLIEYDYVEDSSDTVISFANCEFKRDLGPIKKGQTFDLVIIFFEDCFKLVAQNYDANGDGEETTVNLTIAHATS